MEVYKTMKLRYIKKLTATILSFVIIFSTMIMTNAAIRNTEIGVVAHVVRVNGEFIQFNLYDLFLDSLTQDKKLIKLYNERDIVSGYEVIGNIISYVIGEMYSDTGEIVDINSLFYADVEEVFNTYIEVVKENPLNITEALEAVINVDTPSEALQNKEVYLPEQNTQGNWVIPEEPSFNVDENGMIEEISTAIVDEVVVNVGKTTLVAGTGGTVSGVIKGTDLDSAVTVKLMDETMKNDMTGKYGTVTYGGTATERTFTFEVNETIVKGNYNVVAFVGRRAQSATDTITVNPDPAEGAKAELAKLTNTLTVMIDVALDDSDAEDKAVAAIVEKANETIANGYTAAFEKTSYLNGVLIGKFTVCEDGVVTNTATHKSDITMSITTSYVDPAAGAKTEAAKITSTTAAFNISDDDSANDSAILDAALAKAQSLVAAGYTVTIKTSSISGTTLTVVYTVTGTDSDNTVDTDSLDITFTISYPNYHIRSGVNSTGGSVYELYDGDTRVNKKAVMLVWVYDFGDWFWTAVNIGSDGVADISNESNKYTSTSKYWLLVGGNIYDGGAYEAFANLADGEDSGFDIMSEDANPKQATSSGSFSQYLKMDLVLTVR